MNQGRKPKPSPQSIAAPLPLIRRACICRPPENGMIFRDPNCHAHECAEIDEPVSLHQDPKEAVLTARKQRS